MNYLDVAEVTSPSFSFHFFTICYATPSPASYTTSGAGAMAALTGKMLHATALKLGKNHIKG